MAQHPVPRACRGMSGGPSASVRRVLAREINERVVLLARLEGAIAHDDAACALRDEVHRVLRYLDGTDHGPLSLVARTALLGHQRLRRQLHLAGERPVATTALKSLVPSEPGTAMYATIAVSAHDTTRRCQRQPRATPERATARSAPSTRSSTVKSKLTFTGRVS